MANSRFKIWGLILPAILCLFLASCSTTSQLTDGEMLYNGNKLNVTPPHDVKLPGALDSEITDAVNVKPNNPWPLISPYKRSPFPIGLWVYNHWSEDSKGLKGLIYRWLAKPPVLVSDVRPELRTKMIEQVLDNNGYFGSTATYRIETGRNPKKGTIIYDVHAGYPARLDSILPIRRDSIPACRFIDSLTLLQPYLAKGEIFNVDSLSSVRVAIANRMRNRGYYYFRPEYIEFLADTFMVPGKVVLQTSLASNVPAIALRPFTTGNIYTTIQRRSKRNPGTPDTIQTSRGELIVMQPQKIRPNMIPSCITFRKGKLFSVRDMDRTQTRLSRLGIYQSIQIQPVPTDTSMTADPVMDVYITCRPDLPIEASVEVNASSKSNSYIGPGLALNMTHHNLFGGAEKFTIKLTGSYEWQTGRERSSVFNSYEFGLRGSLAFPRLLAPKFIKRTNRDINWTTVSLGGNVLNRPHYFMLADYDMGISYEWRASRNSLNQFTPLKISYNKLIRTTHAFDSVMARNPAVAQSFESRFIPQMNYTYTLDKWLERQRINGITLTVSATEAGNILNGIYTLCGAKGERRMFGTPFSQFVKGQVQLVYNRRLVRGSDQWLVSRVLVGAEHAYGNSTQVPYSEQFYIGGANSIRAFTVRSLGPGSYKSPRDRVNGYFDQTGTFKLELNSEYRFPIVSILHGALFVDAGNIWLLENNPYRPGGKLEAKTFLRDIALGTGVGLRVDIGMLVIRGDLGYGLHNPYYDDQRHYFNIRFRDAFAFHLAIGYPF